MNEQNDLADLQRNWKPPVELSGGGPRDVRLSGAGRAVASLAVAMFLGAIVAPVVLSRIASRQAAEREELRSSGRETEAVVTRHWRNGGKSNTPEIAYRFQYDGRSYVGTASAPQSIWRGLYVGSPIAVRFSPRRPELNHPDGWEPDVMPRWVPAYFAVMLVAIGILLVFLIRRQTRLLSEGLAAAGRVVGYRRVKGGKMLRYEFPLRSGAIARGSGGQTRRPPPVGSTICVIYDRDNPKRNAPYPLHLARVDR